MQSPESLARGRSSERTVSNGPQRIGAFLTRMDQRAARARHARSESSAGDGRAEEALAAARDGDDGPSRTEPARDEALEAIWHRAQAAIQRQIRREQFETWFRRAALVGVDDGDVCLAVHNGFTRDWLETYYREVLESAFESVLGGPRRVRFSVDPEMTIERSAPKVELEPEATAPTPAATPAPRARPSAGLVTEVEGLLGTSDVVLNAQYRFDTFVVGPCNRFAHAACVGVAESPGRAYNPLFIHGSVGLGKTHLLQSLCHSMLDRASGMRILYLSCESFVNHFIGALENADLQKFRNKYRNVDLLVVDDIHLLANKERTQEEFFHTFNTLYNAGKQIVLSSDSPPVDIPTLQERLVSRFKWGLVTEIEKPCFETRMAILKRKSRERGQMLSDDVARLVAERIESNIRELEGAVTKLIGFAGVAGRPLDVDLVRECLRELFPNQRREPTMEDILRAVTQHFGVKMSELQSKRRSNAIAFPRQVGMFLARRITRMSLEEIGGWFGGRDHSTVLHAVRKIERLNGEDPATRKLISDLAMEIQSPTRS